MLEIKNLCVKREKKIIIKDMSININQGEIVGLVGPNGSGKSTLIKACAGVVKKSRGTIICNGKDYDNDFNNYMENIQVCFDKATFYPWLSAYENLKQNIGIYDVSREDIINALKIVGLKERMNERIQKYSFGMKQRLNIAQMIITKRPVIFLDEPLNGIDPDGIVLFRDILKKMQKEYKCSILVSSHLLGELKNICDRILFIKNGEIVENYSMKNIDNQTYKVTVDSVEKVMKLFNDRYCVEEESDTKIKIEISEMQLNNFISEMVNNRINIKNIENYNDIEKIYLDKIGGE